MSSSAARAARPASPKKAPKRAEPDLVVLSPEDEEELERAIDEADEDMKHGRCVPLDEVFPRARAAG
jgi:hypothetical protein